MVVQVIDIGGMAIFESEDHAPVGADRDSPETGVLSLQPVEPEARQVHVARGGEAFSRAKMSRMVSRCSGRMRRSSPRSINRLSALLLKFRIMADRNMHYVGCQQRMRPAVPVPAAL